MPLIRKGLLQLIFSGAYLLRWNDKLRPTELLEIDKQAHKMLLAKLTFALRIISIETEIYLWEKFLCYRISK